MSFPLAPGARIGILGGGQLARMLAMAAARLGFDATILTPERDAPASRVAARTILADYDEPAALDELATTCDVVTFEFENVPAAAVGRLTARGVAVAPGERALEISQDRIEEKSFANAVGIPTVAFSAVERLGDIEAALATLGTPVLLKTRRGGYDGKGQVWVRRPSEAKTAFSELGERPAIAEAPADFRRELAIIGARGRDGEIALYPLTESHHENGILRRTTTPARDAAKAWPEAERIAVSLLTSLDYVGVMGIELFERDDGRLLLNEFAPRVHNTGHWTLDGCEVDQFEQHIRAICGWPLGPARAVRGVEMINLLGDEIHAWPRYAAEPETRLWFYGKAEARPGRKMGHVNRMMRAQT